MSGWGVGVKGGYSVAFGFCRGMVSRECNGGIYVETAFHCGHYYYFPAGLLRPPNLHSADSSRGPGLRDKARRSKSGVIDLQAAARKVVSLLAVAVSVNAYGVYFYVK